MIKKLIALLILSMLAVGCAQHEEKESSQAANPPIIKSEIVKVEENMIKPIEQKETTLVEEEKESKRPIIDGIPLNDKVLEYIWNKSIEYDFAYTLLLAIVQTESGFNAETISDTSDVGLFQVHRSTAKWIASELGVKKYDLSDEYTSIDFGVYYLSSVRDAWRKSGASEEDVFDMTVISYNRGVTSANRYVKKYGVKRNKYLQTVLKNKEAIEMRME